MDIVHKYKNVSPNHEWEKSRYVVAQKFQKLWPKKKLKGTQ